CADNGGATFGADLFAARNTVLRFLIKQGSLRCAAALLRQRQHLNVALYLALAQRDYLADAYRLARLDALAIDMDLAAFDHLLCQRARLVETRRPQPLVDAHLVHVGSTSCQRSMPGY